MQSAIASTPTAAWQGYLLGGVMWFCIPFTLSTSLGLATVALDLPVSSNEANMGLVPVAAASVSFLEHLSFIAADIRGDLSPGPADECHCS